MSGSAEPARPRRLLPRLRSALSASRLLLLSFAGAIAVGALGFALVPGLVRGGPLSAVDALFMATSAVCVTGLTVLDVSRDLTPWGQLWLLVLFQAGGLGILTFASLFVALLGRRASLHVEEATHGPASVLPPGGARPLLRLVVTVTVALEALGAFALWLGWADRFGPLRAAWLAVFHAVSAFCNAGFDLFGDSLQGFADDAWTLSWTTALIVVGGIGFLVLQDVRRRVVGGARRLTLHSQLALLTTAALLAASTAGFALFEWGNTLAHLPGPARVLNALFMGVTARTAGFATVDYDQVTNPAFFLTLALMWIGGSPGSVAGGVKTTTVALLGLLLWARLRGRRRVSFLGRTVPEDTLERATGLAVGAFLLLAAFVFLLLASERATEAGAVDRLHFARLVFEVQSAFSTVGLSMGATGELTPTGRLLAVALMFLGRVGPLAVLGAMAAGGRRRARFRYAHEDVMVG